MDMATHTENIPSTRTDRDSVTSPSRRDQGRIYDRPGGDRNKSMMTFLLVLAIVVAAIIVLAWLF